MRKSHAILFALTAFSVPQEVAAEQPVDVMVLGVFHMSNPGKDIYDMRADDVLSPKRQREIAAITARLNRFRPTKVAVEWDAPLVAERYPEYLEGTLPPTRNEVVQLGFRLGKLAGNKPVYGIDADGDFPYLPLKAYADAHGFGAQLDSSDAEQRRGVDEQHRLLETRGIASALRYVNEPAQIQDGQSWYRKTLFIGGGKDQPGVDLLTGWYQRNFRICANLLQISKPGDRIVVIFGSGHLALLRQCVAETPGFRLVEPNSYLPR